MVKLEFDILKILYYTYTRNNKDTAEVLATYSILFNGKKYIKMEGIIDAKKSVKDLSKPIKPRF